MYCATDRSVATMSFNDFSCDDSGMNLEFGNFALMLFFFFFFASNSSECVCMYAYIKQDLQYYNGIPRIIIIIIINLIFIGS